MLAKAPVPKVQPRTAGPIWEPQALVSFGRADEQSSAVALRASPWTPSLGNEEPRPEDEGSNVLTLVGVTGFEHLT